VTQPMPNGQPRRTQRIQNGDGASAGPPSGVQPGPAGTQQSRIAPPEVVPSLEVLNAEFTALVQSNQAKFAELAAQGTAPDPFYLVHARINHLIDSIAGFAGPNGPRWAAHTRLEFERHIAGELEQVGPVARRMQLAEGGRYTPTMIRELARQSTTVRRTQ
jgi:hypothetical protein